MMSSVTAFRSAQVPHLIDQPETNNPSIPALHHESTDSVKYTRARSLSNTADLAWLDAAFHEGLASSTSEIKRDRDLGFQHMDGTDGVTRDRDKALEYFMRAANRGDAKSQNALGRLYSLETPPDDTKALHYTQKSAAQKNATALRNLGAFYEAGRGGLLKDTAKAHQLYLQSFLLGDHKTGYDLGRFYTYGLGGQEINHVAALEHYKKAANSGNTSANFALAVFHEEGLGGLKKNPRLALELYKLAAAHGEKKAHEHIKRLS